MSVAASRTTPPARGLHDTLRSWLRPSRREGVIRVLVVDDDPVNRLVISAHMQSRELVFLLAEDGAEAVSLARKMHFDLILMDLQMPTLGGFEATAAIRRNEVLCARPAVPVVAYSSTIPGDGLLESHGMSGSLTKPCDEQGLEDCLVKWCPTYRSARTGAGTTQAQQERPQPAR